MRRFSAGLRAVVAMLVALRLLSGDQPSVAALAVLVGYGLWTAHLLWAAASGRPPRSALLHYWIDVAWTGAMLQLSPSSAGMLVLTLVQPVVLASIGHGVRSGMRLAAFGALTVLVDPENPMMSGMGTGGIHALPALGVLALVPAAALLSRPMSLLRERLALLGDIEATLDPRRGLQAVSAQLVEQLRLRTGAQVAGLVLPSATGAWATLSTAEEGSFRTSAEVHRRLEALLTGTPACPLMHTRRRGSRRAGGTRLPDGSAASAALGKQMDTLAELLEAGALVVVPLTRYERRHGHILLGLPDTVQRPQDVMALAQAAPELLCIVEQAALADQLQLESECHERARIGRDLHDSAIQPYLGLKYAVETVALRIPPDNPARAEVEALAALVNGEVAALRELISGLRAGASAGDSPLVPAVRRQVRRFAQLFGMEIELDCPDHLVTTRALADALFHMVNEALNNIRKHSGARHVWLRMAIEGNVFVLVVRDDAGTLAGKPVPPFQPRSLTERATELGGLVRISHPDGLNTELLIEIPLVSMYNP
jgi:signal transduction histidine kinase